MHQRKKPLKNQLRLASQNTKKSLKNLNKLNNKHRKRKWFPNKIKLQLQNH